MLWSENDQNTHTLKDDIVPCDNGVRICLVRTYELPEVGRSFGDSGLCFFLCFSGLANCWDRNNVCY